MDIHESILEFYSPENHWYRSRLDVPINCSQAVLESVVGRYLIYCYLDKDRGNTDHILSTLEFFGDIIPRLIIRDGRTAQELDAQERKKGLWVNERDCLDKPCAIRFDAGCGQFPIANIGLYLSANELGKIWSKKIAEEKFMSTYYGKCVPQGKLLTVIPPLGNNCTEAVCMSYISSKPIPWCHTARCRISLDNCMPYDKPEHRSLLLWFLSLFGGEHKKRFSKWIATRDCDLPGLEAKYNQVKDSVGNSDYLTGVLDWLLQNEIRK